MIRAQQVGVKRSKSQRNATRNGFVDTVIEHGADNSRKKMLVKTGMGYV